MIHNMVGGGGGKLRAVIAVTYPEGSVCTCSNGTKTLKARDTSGKALFNVTVGEWTVTATDGDNTESVTVSITQEGQFKNVELMYGLYLYNAGDQCTAVTGGWSSAGYSNVGVIAAEPTYGETKISFSGADGQHVVACTVNPIDLTDFDEIVFFGAVTETAIYNGIELGLVLAISKTKDFANFVSRKVLFKGTYTESNGGLPITNLTGEYYVAVFADGLYGISGYMTQLLLK